MERLLAQLIASGTIDASAAEWALDHQDQHGGGVDTALLELDLIDEDELVRGLAACFGAEPGTRADLARAVPTVGERFPDNFGRSFRMCPLSATGDRLVAMVESPLPGESIQELRDLFGIEVTQLVAPSHYLALARELVYGTPRDGRTQRLEARLARRRRADVRRALDDISSAASPTAGATYVLELAACLVESASFLVADSAELRVVATLGRGPDMAASFPYPEPTCTLAAAFRHRGYFLGPLEADADERFFGSIGRDTPRCAFIAPVPGAPVVFFADNGERGMSTRSAAELTLLVSRLGQQTGDWELDWDWGAWAADAEAALSREIRLDEPPTASAEAEVEPAADDAPTEADTERVVLARLRRAAANDGKTLEAFVDELLRKRGRRKDDGTRELAGEVKGLFEKLATDIPAQLARGMEAAFRDMVPRLSGSAAAAPATAPVAQPTAKPGVEIVQAEATPRDVPSYRSRRGKTKRVKL